MEPTAGPPNDKVEGRIKNYERSEARPRPPSLIVPVRSMRIPIVCWLVALLTANANAQKSAPADAIRSASFAYSSQITTAILQAVVPELAKNFRQLHGSLKFSFHLDRGGHVSAVKVVSSTSNRFVEKTTVRAIRAFKFPPIPKAVIAEQGHDWVDIDSEMSFERH